MPDQSAHLSDFYKGGHLLRCFMSVFVGELVMEGEILDPLIQNIEVLFNVITGTTDDIRPGFRADIVTSDGRFKGRTRISYGSTISEHNVYIRETSAGSIDIQVGDHIRIYREVRLSDKLPNAALIDPFSPDNIRFSTEGEFPAPLPTSGGAWAGWSRMLPVLMTGSESALVAPGSSTLPTHDWSETDGLTISSGMDTDADIEFSGDAGSYLPAHVVTDPDGGASITQYTPVVIHDKAHPPYKVVVEDLPNEETKGGAGRVRMLQSILLADVPDGSLVILWKEEFIAETRQSFGARAPGRSHILFVGYLRSESGEFESANGVEGLTFSVISPLARLDELMGYSKVILNDATPEVWGETVSLTVRRAMIQLAMYYSNVLECFDWVFTSTFQDYDYPGLFLDTSTPIGQLRELADGDDCRVIEDRRGRFEAQMRPELVALSDRDDLPITLILAPRAIKSWKYTREHWRPVNRLQLNAFVAGYGDNPAVFSEWPGPSPGEGNQTSAIDKIISASQADANERAGRRGAAADGIYIDADGVQQAALDLELVLRGVFDVFDFYDELIELDVTANRRGIDFSGMQYVFVGSSINFSNGTAETTVRFRTCTNGVAGSTYIPPTSPIADYTPPDLTPVAQPVATTTGSRVPTWNGVDQLPTRLIAYDSGGAHCHVATLWTPSSSVLTYTDADSAGLSGVNHWATADPWNYGRYFPLQSTGLYRNDDPFGGSSHSLVANNATLFGSSGRVGKFIAGSINRRGYFAILCGTHYVYTTDYWATIHDIDIRGGAGSYQTSLNNDSIFAISPYNSGATGWVYAYLNGVGLYKSTDWGATWTLLIAYTTTGVNAFLGPLTVPYVRLDGSPNLNNSSQELFSWRGKENGGNESAILFSNTAGVSWAFQWHVNSGSNFWIPSRLIGTGWNGITFTYNSNILMLAGTNNSNETLEYVGISTDAGVSQDTTTNLGAFGSGDQHINGFPVHSQAALAFSRSDTDLHWTIDDGTNWEDTAAPSGYSGVSYVEWNLSLLVPPA